MDRILFIWKQITKNYLDLNKVGEKNLFKMQ